MSKIEKHLLEAMYLVLQALEPENFKNISPAEANKSKIILTRQLAGIKLALQKDVSMVQLIAWKEKRKAERQKC